MGLLDQIDQAFGSGFDDPKSAAIMAFSGGLLSGNYGNALLGANDAYAQHKANALKTQMAQMQMEEQKQKIEDARKQREFLSSLPSPQMQASMTALGGGGGPTNANAANIRPVSPIQDMMFRGAQSGAIGLPDYIKSLQPKELPFGKVDPKDYTPESIRAFAQSGGDHTKLVPMRKMDVVNNQAVDLYKAPPGTVFDTLDPNKPFNLQGGRITPNAPFQQYDMGRAKAGATSVSVNTGQKGLENELNVHSKFRQEPIYKAQQEVQSAYSQITQALKQNSPAGDMAGATKIMKLLDPGSVVRESELGMAMAATGLMDKVTNYGQMVMSGQKLTPTQRKDFQNLADVLYTESVKQYNGKRREYAGFATDYGLNADRIVGPEITSPKLPAVPGRARPAIAPASGLRFLGFEGQ